MTATIDDLAAAVTALSTNAAAQVNAINIQKTYLDAAVAGAAGIAAAEASVAGTLATIKNAYYGALATAPALRPDGAARQVGDRYYDSVALAEKTWNGSAWVVASVDTSGITASGGAALVMHGTESVAAELSALQLADYAALRAYAGARKSVYVTGYLVSAAPSGIAGMFLRDDNDTTTADNGGTVIATAGGKRYKRAFSGPLCVEWFGLVLDGATDNTARVQAALDTGATDVLMPPGQCKIISTLFLRQNQTLRGPRRTNNNTLVTYGATILFRPVAADTCVTNAPGTDSNGVEDLQFDGNRNDSFAIGFLSSYANKVKRCGFRGTWDVGLYAHDTYVCEFDELAFTGASIKHNCIYVGQTNATKISRAHISALPNDVAVCSVGIALRSGVASTIEDCVMQGVTVGIHLYGPYSTVIRNPYFENTVCNIKGDSVATPYSTTIIGGGYSGPYNTHPQYASRGPLIYSGNMQGVTMTQPNFLNTNVMDANIWPILFGSAGGGEWTIQSAKYTGASGGSRAQIFRETAGASPSLTVMGEPYGANGAVELLMKQDGSYGGNCQGIRVGAAGAITATSWTPAVIATAVPALLKGAFYVPTMP